MSIRVFQEEAAERFVVHADLGDAVLEYRRPDPLAIDLIRTYVPDALRGRGFAGALVKHALEFADDEGLEVLATCPYVKRYVQRHPKYQELVGDPIPV
jgi:predicted GNAT family acetyltransferase